MRIAVNARFLIKNKMEGMGWFTYEVVRRLVETYPEHEYYLFFDRPDESLFLEHKNVHSVVLFPPSRHPFLHLIWFEWAVANALKKYKIDVFFSPDNFLTLRTKVPTVLVTHDIAHRHFPDQVSFFDRWYYRILVPRFLRKAQKIVAVSSFTKEDIVRNYQIDPHKIVVACNGCREAFRPLNEVEKKHIRAQYAEGKPYFFYVGAIQPRKNIHRLIRAFDAFKSETGGDIKLLLGGRFAWKTGAVKTAFEQARHRADILFTGYLPESELPKVMGGAFAFVYPSLFEGFGIPILEAMFCDVPVITSNVSSMPEVAGEAGILVTPTDEFEIKAAMRRYWEDPHLYRQKVAAGRKQRSKFNWERAAEVVYDSLLGVAKAKG
ncbi:MAG: glycosyltransferase family 1 protein [Bacteroidetes bacterium]|nr:MAG: glycosyltransferase family 1 protein [Bacteroidota bacterium]